METHGIIESFHSYETTEDGMILSAIQLTQYVPSGIGFLNYIRLFLSEDGTPMTRTTVCLN